MHQVIGFNLIELISADYLCDPCCLAGNLFLSHVGHTFPMMNFLINEMQMKFSTI